MDTNNPTAGNPAAPEGNSLNIPIVDGSADQAALDAHIDEVLGLPTQEAPKNDSKTDRTGDGKGGDGADGGAGDKGGEGKSGEAGDGAGADQAAADAAQAEADAAAETAKSGDKGAKRPTVKVEDAGDKAPNGSPLTLTVKDKTGKDFVLKPGDDLDEVLAEFDPKSTGQIMKIISDFQKLNADQVARDAANAAQEATQQQEQARAAQVDAWDTEITNLQADNRVPKPVAKPGSAAWKADPAVVRVSEVFEFMTKENAKRQAAGSSNFITSFEDALDKIERAEMSTKLADRTKTDTATADETARTKAGRIQGAGGRGNNAPAPYRPGQYASIWDIPD